MPKNKPVLFYRNRGISDPVIRDSGILPFLPDDGTKYYLRGDGTWQPIEPPIVEHGDLHTAAGEYEES
jgi:hypothetical protein